MSSIKILIAEDHPLTIAGLTMLVDTRSDWINCGQIADGALVLSALERHRPDVLLLDLALPNRTGLDLLHDLRDSAYRPRTVIISGNDDTASFQRAWDNGADAVVRKTDQPDVIVEAIDTIVQEQRFISPNLRNLLTIDSAHHADDLTSRELQVLRCMAQGFSSRKTGDYLSISAGTARKHRENLMRKLEATSAITAVQQARRLGLLSAE